MTSYFPDINVWFALSVAEHDHSLVSWRWRRSLPSPSRWYFSRYTHIGLVRLLCTPAAMTNRAMSLKKAWVVYENWLADPAVAFHPEPQMIEERFRLISESLGDQPAAKAVGDCYLLAYALETRSTLVTFDKALLALAQKCGCRAVRPA